MTTCKWHSRERNYRAASSSASRLKSAKTPS